jgi:hypothetical protein
MEFSKTFFLRMKKEKLAETAVAMGLTNEYSVGKYGRPANKLLKTQLLEWIETIGRQQQTDQLQQLFSQLSLKPKKKMATNSIDQVIECVVTGSQDVAGSQGVERPDVAGSQGIEPRSVLNISVYEPLPEVPDFQTSVAMDAMDTEIFAPPPEFSDAATVTTKKTVTFDVESLVESVIAPMTSPQIIYPPPAVPPVKPPLPFTTSRPIIFPKPAIPPVVLRSVFPPPAVAPLTVPDATVPKPIVYPPPAVAPLTVPKPIVYPPPSVAPLTVPDATVVYPPPAVSPPVPQPVVPPPATVPASTGAIPKVPLKSLLRPPGVFESPSIFDLPVEQPVLVLTEPPKPETVVNLVNPVVKLVTPSRPEPKITKKKEDIRTQILNAKDVADVLKAIRNPNTVHIATINQVDYNISRTFGLCY